MTDSKKKVLVVEDHAIAKKIAVTIFESLKCDVDTADDGLQALALIEKNKYNLIALDIGLPYIDGFELAKKIRQMEAEGKHIPIIALTAHTDEVYMARCIENGMDDSYSKPLTIEIAKVILDNHLQDPEDSAFNTIPKIAQSR